MPFTRSPLGELFSCHLPEADCFRLDEMCEAPPPGVCVCRFDTGWFVRVGAEPGTEDPEDMNEAVLVAYWRRGLSDTFLELARAAQVEGLSFLRIHAEAVPAEHLEDFVWGVD